MADPTSTYRENARDTEEMVVALRDRLLRVRAEIEDWLDARHGLRSDGEGSTTDPDAWQRSSRLDPGRTGCARACRCRAAVCVGEREVSAHLMIGSGGDPNGLVRGAGGCRHGSRCTAVSARHCR